MDALVFGGSGVSGWAVLLNALSFPSKDTFSKVTGLTNRPLTVEKAQLPQDPRLSLYSGVDLCKDLDDVIADLKKSVPDIESVTHVYYLSFKGSENGDMDEVKKVNKLMTSNAIQAVEALSPKLKYIVLQTGSNHYGVTMADDLGDKFGPAPLKESYARIPSPMGDSLFYYAQVDEITRLQKGKSWNWCEPRPDVVVGFVPNNNVHNMNQSLGLYLSFFAYLNGQGAKVPFPGSADSWKCQFTMIGQDQLAKFSIYASLHPEATASKPFNVADGHVRSWGEMWPALTKYFGLEGVGPVDAGEESPCGEKWVQANAEKVKEWETKGGLKPGQLEAIPWWYFDFAIGAKKSRQMDLSEMRKTGFKEEIETSESFIIGWDRMKKLGLIPK